MFSKTSTTVLSLLAVLLLFPSAVLSKRPKTIYEPFLSEEIETAREMEHKGDMKGAEEKYLEIYESCKKDMKWGPTEQEWLNYMACIRAIISFYYGTGNFQEVNWYFREYSEELEGDEEIGALQLQLLLDVSSVAEKQIGKGEFQKAELIYLDFEDRLTSTLGHQHFLLGELYKKMAYLYVKMGNQENAKMYGEKASLLMKDQ